MPTNRFVVLGLANVRSAWFRDVGRWASSAAIPVDFVKCVSVEEVGARLSSGRSFSAVMFDGTVSGVHRDLIDQVLDTGAAALIVDDGRAGRDWRSIGATAIVDHDFDRAELVDTLERHARPIARIGDQHQQQPDRSAAGWSGHLTAVVGVSGTGASTVAMALAQGLGSDPRFAGRTLLADLALHADQAMMHHAGDIVPGLQEAVDAHRLASPGPSELRSFVYDTIDRGYHLLLGLRHHRDWTTLRPRALAATLDNLRRSYSMLVVDIEADLEGEDQVGSTDIEDRNMLARTSVHRADLVIAVGAPTTKGLHGLVRLLHELLAFGVGPERILPVLNRSGRSSRPRALASAAFGDLVKPHSTALASPIHLPEPRRLEDAYRDASPLPRSLCDPLTSAVVALLDHVEPSRRDPAPEPVAIRPGTLGHYSDDTTDADDGAGFPESEAS